MIFLIVILLVIDRISKILANGINIKIINKFLYFHYAENTGIAFSLFRNNNILIVLLTTLIIAYIIYYVVKQRPNKKIYTIGYSLLLAGAISNLIDRIAYGYVIDFIDVYMFGYDYPIFNLADSFIVIGIVLLLLGGYYDNNKRKWRSRCQTR